MGTWSTHEATEAARYGLKPGDMKHGDKDNDGQIDLIADGQIMGRAWPRLIANVRNTFRYKNFDAYLDVSFVEDRKSTRLNSSHVAISYAVFCLKKKNIKI